jgi:uncharacterized membrane protein YphA (DoxX/SURF4 family)
MLEGWYFMTAALLVLSGGSKLRDPEPTRGALRAARLPSSRGVVLGLAGIEVAVGALALGLQSPLAAAAVAAVYLGFAGFVAFALLRDIPLQSCGCFGKSDIPPGWLHVAVNLSAVGAAAAVATRGGADLIGLLDSQPAAGLPYLAFVALGAYLMSLILTHTGSRTA